MITANLVVEEVFVDVQCQSKQREQTSSKGNHSMALAGANQTNEREQGNGRY